MNTPSWIGRSLGGRYQIEQLLGQGGMSAVYKANDPNLRRVVAVKLIHSHLSWDPRFVHRFEEEAAAVAQLRHPNIIQVFDFNQDEGTYYMVMEFIPGETLQDRLQRYTSSKRFISMAKVVQYTINICSAIGYAHKRGIVHRDIKPANIMIDVHDQAILMDFGIVKIVGAEKFTATGAVVGTALYMPPEVIRGEAPDPRSDIYSLGVTLYEGISGRPPFKADSAMTLMMMHLNDPLPDLTSERPGAPPELAAVIERALAKERSDRFVSAEEFAEALQALLPLLAGLEPASPSSGVQPALTPPPAVAASIPKPAIEVEQQPETEPELIQTIRPAPQPIVEPAPAPPTRTPAPTWASPIPASVSEARSSAADTGPTLTVPKPVQAHPGMQTLAPAPAAYAAPAGGSVFNLRSPLVMGAGLFVILVLIVAVILFAGSRLRSTPSAAGGTPADNSLIKVSANATLTVLAAAAFEIPAPTETTAPTSTVTDTPLPSDTPMPTHTPTQAATPTPDLFVVIKSINIENGLYIVDYETFGYTEKLPGMHVHFFFNTVLPENAGMPGSGPWKLYGGPRPFKGYRVSNRPAQATQMCSLVANADHSVIQNSGTCLDLP
jgi:serine/threonine protein kinase